VWVAPVRGTSYIKILFNCLTQPYSVEWTTQMEKEREKIKKRLDITFP
jgi:hypothetical protein